MSNLFDPVTAEDHMLGPFNALVTLVEYGDYECPHCGRAYGEMQKILSMMDNKFRFVFRHFPMTRAHPFALQAAIAAEAADAQGRFWKMHDLLFENQKFLSIEVVMELCGRIGLDCVRFGLDLDQPRFKDFIHRQFMGGVKSGVSGTPTFFLNGARVEGSWEGGNLLRALEKAHRAQSNYYL